MLRAIIRIVDTGAAANVGGPVDVSYITIDFDAPAIELEIAPIDGSCQVREVIGIELLRDYDDSPGSHGEQPDDRPGQGGR